MRELTATRVVGGRGGLAEMTRIVARAEDEQTAVTMVGTEGDPAPEEDLDAGLVLGPGSTVQQYELIRAIGSGGMGAVYLARDTRLGRRVAIKFLHTTDGETNQRFLLEARTTASCSHENIVVIHEVGRTRGRALHGARVPARPVAEEAGGGTARPGTARGRADRASGPGAGVRARAEHRPPRPQARQRHRHRLGHHQGARLRDRQGSPVRRAEGGSRRRRRGGRRGGLRRGQWPGGHHQAGIDSRHAPVHGSRAVEHGGSGSPRRHLGGGHHAVPDARRAAPAGAAAGPTTGGHQGARDAHAVAARGRA